jgi:hypothetical protein
MTPPAPPGAWADLTGASPRWVRTVVYAALVGRLAALPLGLIVGAVWGEAGFAGFSGLIEAVDLRLILLAVVFAPLVEQLLVLVAVGILHWGLRFPPWPAALISAAGCCALHGLVPASILVFPLFALLGIVQINRARRGSLLAGFGLGVLIHALANGVAVLSALALGL